MASPVAPTIKTLPDLTLKRAKGLDTLVFVGTAVDPGFNASANYFLEACARGNNFKDSILLVSSIEATALKITVSNLNGILLKKFPANQASAVDFRIRSVLVVDAGTGAIGTSLKPFVYISETKSADVTIYGLPRLDLISSGITQKIESDLGDGKYTGLVKLDATKPFTLRDPDGNIVYGANGAALVVNGTGISAGTNGWYQISANTSALTFAMNPYQIGLIGSATPNAWNSPDQKMNYNAQTGTWSITIDLVVGEVKFRKNDGWSWNLGYNATKTSLEFNGSNIPIAAPGNYSIILTITNDALQNGTFTIVKNN